MSQSSIKRLVEIDASIRKRGLKPRALKEEAGYGLTDEEPMRRKGESDSYWYIRLLTYKTLGLSYRVPQMNMYLLEDHINSRTFGLHRIKHCIYVAGGTQNMRYTTEAGRLDFNAHEAIDVVEFLRRFGLDGTDANG